MTLKIAIIGAGRIADAHMLGYKALGDKVKIVAVVDENKELAKEKAHLWGAEQYFEDYKKALTRNDIDAVDICLPHHLHLSVALDCIKANKHVLIEKPLARNIEEAQIIGDAVHRSGITFMVAHNLLFNPILRKAKELIDKGYIGSVQFLKAYSAGFFLFLENDFRLSLEKTGGGVFIDTGAHFVYMARELAGEIKSVFGMTGRLMRKEMEGEDNAFVLIEFESGALGELTTSYSARIPGWRLGFPAGWDQTFHIYGTEGAIRFNLPDSRIWVYSEKSDVPQEVAGWSELRLGVTYDSAFEYEVKHFVECLLENKTPKVTVDDGIRVIKIIDAVYKSSTKGEKILID